MISNHGQSVQYVHDDIGVNSRLDAIQAAILNVKLPRLDAYANSRRRAADFYDKAFASHPNIKIPQRAAWSTHVFHQYTITLCSVDRDQLREQLAAKGIPTMIYYPKPLHHQKAYASSRFRDEDFQHTISLCKNVLSLPMHTELDEETLGYICSELISAINNQTQ